MLNDTITQAEEVVHGFIPLVYQVGHLEGRLNFEGNPQEVENLKIGHAYTFVYIHVLTS